MGSNENDFDTYSHVEYAEIHFVWEIRDFSECDLPTGKALMSKKFPRLNGDTNEWQLVLYPYGKDTRATNHISLYLKHIANEEEIASSRSKFSFENKYGEILASCSFSKHYFIFDERISGFPKFAARRHILPYLPDDTLYVNCWIKWTPYLTETSEESLLITKQLTPITKPPPPITKPPSPITKKPDVLSELLIDFNELMISSSLSDVTLLSNDGSKFFAHKCILAARSPIFAAMFEHDMKEKRESTVEIKDLDANTVKCMLEFIYTSRFYGNNDIEKVLAAADKYDLKKLRILCEQKLIELLSVQNAANYLLLGDRYYAEALKKQSLCLIKNNLKSVLETEAMKNLAAVDPTLFYQTLQASSE